VVLLASQACVARLSAAFVFGVGHRERPILGFLGLEAVALVAYFVAVELVRRGPPRRWHLPWIAIVALACRAALAPANMIQEVDPYRYVWDGQAVLQGANPYVLAPAEAHAGRRAPAVGLGDAGAATYERIGYRDVPTIYPPVAQGLFALSQWLSPWGLGGWRGMILLAEAASVVLLVAAASRAARPPGWVVVYAWSPLVLKEFSNGLHLDVFAVLGLCVLVWAVLRERLLLAFVALAWTALVKVFAVALVPVLATLAWRRDPRRALRGVLVFVFLVGVAYLPWIGAGPEVFDGLVIFAERWQRNASLFALAAAVTARHARLVCALAGIGVVVAAGSAVYRNPTAMRACGALLAVVVAIFLLAPTANPWYFTWAVPFLVLFPSRALLLLSGLVLLYYAEFHFLYRDQPGLLGWLHLVEYAPFYLALVVEVGHARRRGLVLGA